MNMKISLQAILGGILAMSSITQSFGADETKPAKKAEVSQAEAVGFSGTVNDTMNAGQYTYVEVDTGKEKIWAAAPQFEVKKGQKVIVPDGVPMRDYYSKTLDRTFKTVYFVGAIVTEGSGKAANPMSQAHAGLKNITGKMTAANFDFKGIKKPEGGATVAEIYSRKSALAGKKVTVRGIVVKYNAQIMGKNWIHLRDGTGAEGANDLTVTTSDTAKLGDVVLVVGTVVLDKDFGAGYKYDILLENSKVTVDTKTKP
jgi:hypothetical protein